MDITITTQGRKIHVTTPYHPDFRDAARQQLGGDWSAGKWVFDVRDEQRVRDLCKQIYGTDGTPCPVVDARVRLGDHVWDQSMWMFGRRLLHRPSRDEPVKLGPGVVIVEGELAGSGGSVKNPRIGGQESEDVVIEVRDIPAEHPDLTRADVEVLGQPDAADNDVEALLAERERLLARLAEIDAQLPEPPGVTASTRDAARILGVSIRTVQRWAATGKVEAAKVDGRWQITITQTAD